MSVEDIWKQIPVKLIAILRGIKPEEAQSVVSELLECGFRAIEIPLNSPDAFKSIEIAAKSCQTNRVQECLIGAGTVLDTADVLRVHDAGGNLVVSPNIDAAVISETRALNMFSAPGVYTPSECLAAIGAGANSLKVFPASNLGIDGIKALRAVLPAEVGICAVGGVGPVEFKSYMQAGAESFGLGSSLYKPGMSALEIGKLARQAVSAYQDAAAGM